MKDTYKIEKSNKNMKKKNSYSVINVFPTGNYIDF